MSGSSRSRVPVTAAVACLAIVGCGGGEEPSNEQLFESEGFGQALEAVRGAAGDDAPVLTVQVTDRGAEFHLLGERPRGLIYTGGELTETELGAPPAEGPLSEQAFALREVEPAAIDRLVGGAEERAGGALRPVAIILERSALDGELRWALNVQGGIAFSAGPDGSDPTPMTEVPPAP